MAALRDLPLTWHFIGRVQANKTRAVAEQFAWVHAVDRLKIAERLSAQRPYHAPPLNVCLQVNIAAEATKGGVAAAQLPALAAAVAQLPRLKLRGLMCIPPEEAQAARQRAWFAQLRGLLDELNAGGLSLDTLSMGMSADFEAAIMRARPSCASAPRYSVPGPDAVSASCPPAKAAPLPASLRTVLAAGHFGQSTSTMRRHEQARLHTRRAATWRARSSAACCAPARRPEQLSVGEKMPRRARRWRAISVSAHPPTTTPRPRAPPWWCSP